LIKVEIICDFKSLSKSLKSRQKRNQIKRKLWMTDENIIIKTTWIKSKIKVWLVDTDEPNYDYDYIIDKIIYKVDNTWTTRSIELRHRHPVEYIQIQKIPDGLPVFKFFLDIYIDKFGPYHNAYHTIGGIYLQIRNMSQVMHQKLKNHFLLGFIPFGANCADVLKPLIADIKELENGFTIVANNEPVWITGGLGNIMSDLPEGNEQAGIKHHNANHGCRICTIHYN
jgi:hypothetical protein